MGRITGHLSETRCAEVLAALEAARSGVTRTDQRKGITEALSVQAGILQALEELLERMEKWEDYNEVIKILREVKDLQERVLKDTQDTAKEREKKDGKKD